jgi:hypothetical protein
MPKRFPFPGAVTHIDVTRRRAYDMAQADAALADLGRALGGGE